VPKFGVAPKSGLGLKWKFRGENMDRISEDFIYEKEMYVLGSIWSLEAGISRLCTTASGYAREGGVKMCSRCAEELTRPVRMIEGRILFAPYAINLYVDDQHICVVCSEVNFEHGLYCNVKHRHVPALVEISAGPPQLPPPKT
jgi:hypothetical protein